MTEAEGVATTDTGRSASGLAEEQARKIPGALLRFRVLAWVTGLWLLSLTGEMIYKYLILDDSAEAPGWFFYVAQLHGLFYMLYLAFTVDLAIKARWKAGTTILTAIAGTVPFLSFVFEHIRTKQVKEQFGLS
ncbi:DUF3817 domain-containing protein [Tomitella cavernea]|uniref:DUF3817 domain-containing protein n=1 Tax=Tomitella cavernea TaxID=1387982 RepID=A0ABP9CVE9_9ACTN|nr:DUF3817 domain-containing protein [Tomitella cavernea]